MQLHSFSPELSECVEALLCKEYPIRCKENKKKKKTQFLRAHAWVMEISKALPPQGAFTPANAPCLRIYVRTPVGISCERQPHWKQWEAISSYSHVIAHAVITCEWLALDTDCLSVLCNYNKPYITSLTNWQTCLHYVHTFFLLIFNCKTILLSQETSMKKVCGSWPNSRRLVCHG